MSLFDFEIVIEREPEGKGFYAYSPTLPGCFSNGRTADDAEQNFRAAAQQHIERLLAHGQPMH